MGFRAAKLEPLLIASAITGYCLDGGFVAHASCAMSDGEPRLCPCSRCSLSLYLSLIKIGARSAEAIRACIAVWSLKETDNAHSGRAVVSADHRPDVRGVDWGNALSLNDQIRAERASGYHPLRGEDVANVTPDSATQDKKGHYTGSKAFLDGDGRSFEEIAAERKGCSAALL